MTRNEALANWTHCHQCSRWKDNFTPEGNDCHLANKLKGPAFKDAVIEEVKQKGLWPSGAYSAVVAVKYKGRRGEAVLYLAVRKEG